jgi:hypothetical protein
LQKLAVVGCGPKRGSALRRLGAKCVIPGREAPQALPIAVDVAGQDQQLGAGRGLGVEGLGLEMEVGEDLQAHRARRIQGSLAVLPRGGYPAGDRSCREVASRLATGHPARRRRIHARREASSQGWILRRRAG